MPIPYRKYIKRLKQKANKRARREIKFQNGKLLNAQTDLTEKEKKFKELNREEWSGKDPNDPMFKEIEDSIKEFKEFNDIDD